MQTHLNSDGFEFQTIPNRKIKLQEHTSIKNKVRSNMNATNIFIKLNN
jgi:hypothetical protein